ncbi:MAG: EAL domain-containing protein [Candidatus Dormiibacterota bacterium]
MSVSATSGATPGHRRGRRKPSSGWFRAGIASVVVAGAAAAALILIGGHSLPVTLLALALTASVALGGGAWAEEHHRRRRLQHLYESRLLLQGTSGSPLSVKETLARLCQVLDARFAEVVVLPDAIDSTALVVRVRDGEIVETAQALNEDLLDDVFSVIVPETYSLLLRAGVDKRQGASILGHRGIKDAVMAALVVEGRVLGTVVVGERLGRGRTFDEEDRMLLDALAAQVGVTVERVRFDERLNQQAFHDALTGLANRSLFADRVAHALERRVPPGRYRAAVLFIDLDDFKVVNDSLGHPSGDLLLQAVTQRLRRVVRPFDTVARWGGDEFAVLVEDVAGPEEPLAVAERFLDELRVVFDLNGTGVTIGASIGIAIADSSIASPDDLLRQADVAMYRAKERGKATVETFEPSMQSALESRVQLTGELERGLAAGEVSVEYQPIVALGSGAVVGVEALARWDSPRRGRVAPREFIPVAEASGLIRDLGEQVLRTACLQARRWMQEHPGQDFSVSVNLSPRQLLHAGFADTVGEVLRDTGLPPSRLTLEITESLLVEKTPATLRRLKALKDLGVTLAIDDFGTGYSSLAELKFLPVDALKIPKSFVDNVATDPRERAFLAGIIGLGRTLDLRLVVVGVERAEQRRELQLLRCDLAQGFHFAAPLDADGISDLLARQAGTAPPLIRR